MIFRGPWGRGQVRVHVAPKAPAICRVAHRCSGPFRREVDGVLLNPLHKGGVARRLAQISDTRACQDVHHADFDDRFAPVVQRPDVGKRQRLARSPTGCRGPCRAGAWPARPPRAAAGRSDARARSSSRTRRRCFSRRRPWPARQRASGNGWDRPEHNPAASISAETIRVDVPSSASCASPRPKLAGSADILDELCNGADDSGPLRAG